jgi:hypothetical protein
MGIQQVAGNEKKKSHKKYLSCAANSKSHKMDRESSQTLEGQQKLYRSAVGEPCHDNSRKQVVVLQRIPRGKRELAQEFYWCDERSFYEMQVPFEDARDFALASFTFVDIVPDVHNFLIRVRQAQKAARNYCAWIVASAQ